MLFFCVITFFYGIINFVICLHYSVYVIVYVIVYVVVYVIVFLLLVCLCRVVCYCLLLLFFLTWGKPNYVGNPP